MRNTSEVRSVPQGRAVPWRRDQTSAIAASPASAPVESEFITVPVDPSPPRGRVSSTVGSGPPAKAVPKVPNASVHPTSEIITVEEEPKSVATPKGAPKAVSGPVIPKVKGLGVAVSEARPLELRPQGGPPVASTASSAASVNPTIRLSLNLHGVSDLGLAVRGQPLVSLPVGYLDPHTTKLGCVLTSG